MVELNLTVRLRLVPGWFCLPSLAQKPNHYRPIGLTTPTSEGAPPNKPIFLHE